MASTSAFGTAGWWHNLRQLPGRVPLRVRLITAVLALVAIALGAISIASISFLRTYLISQADGTLQSGSQGLADQVLSPCTLGLMRCPRLQPGGVSLDWLPARGQLQHVILPADSYGQQMPLPDVASAAAWLEAHPDQATTVGAQSGNHRWRLYSFPDVASTPGSTQLGTVVVGLDVTTAYQTLARLTRIDLIVSGIVIIALAVVGAGIVRSSLRPLSDIERTAQKIASGDLSQRVPDRDPQTEVGRLGWALNMMLTQIEGAFRSRADSERAARLNEERMRQFVADASHELRTPVTVIRGYAEYYRQRGGLEPGALETAPATPQAEPPPGPASPAPAASSGPAASPVPALPPGPTAPPGPATPLGPTRPPGLATPAGPTTPAEETVPPPGAAGNGAGPASGSEANGSEPDHLGSVDVDRIMERVEQEAARMGGLVEDLLLLARLDQQRPVERRPVDLLTLAGDAVQDARAVAPNRKIELSAGTGTAFLVLGDEARLRQVIGNLMSNALTHTPDGTKISVRITAGHKAGYPPVPGVTLEVADAGPGMTAEQARHVFERFYRADHTRQRRTGGTGLGLAIVSALVAAHGGMVSLDTVPGRGATFRITLPLAPEAQDPDQ